MVPWGHKEETHGPAGHIGLEVRAGCMPWNGWTGERRRNRRAIDQVDAARGAGGGREEGERMRRPTVRGDDRARRGTERRRGDCLGPGEGKRLRDGSKSGRGPCAWEGVGRGKGPEVKRALSR